MTNEAIRNYELRITNYELGIGRDEWAGERDFFLFYWSLVTGHCSLPVKCAADGGVAAAEEGQVEVGAGRQDLAVGG